jgi:hypothetical protein
MIHIPVEEFMVEMLDATETLRRWLDVFILLLLGCAEGICRVPFVGVVDASSVRAEDGACWSMFKGSSNGDSEGSLQTIGKAGVGGKATNSPLSFVLWIFFFFLLLLLLFLGLGPVFWVIAVSKSKGARCL